MWKHFKLIEQTKKYFKLFEQRWWDCTVEPPYYSPLLRGHPLFNSHFSKFRNIAQSFISNWPSFKLPPLLSGCGYPWTIWNGFFFIFVLTSVKWPPQKTFVTFCFAPRDIRGHFSQFHLLCFNLQYLEVELVEPTWKHL